MTKQEKIAQLKIDKDAVILAHYYAPSDVQDIADYIGDSFYLSRKAKELGNKTIVFAGVSFMGESAKLIAADKTVLMPDVSADCPMAHMVTKETVDRARAEYDDVAVVCYINSTAEIKSWSDVCVTSANAVKIVRNLPNKYILFIPDKNLASYVAQKVPEKEFIYNDGYCPVHEHMKVEEIKKLMSEHEGAPVLAHPECNSDITGLADYIGSTSGIIDYVKENEHGEYIICTEEGVRHALKKARPEAEYYFAATTPVCKDMKRNTLDNIIRVLENDGCGINGPDGNVAKEASFTLKKMLELA
ncbi:MAG: quinolinate synthase NadA [Lachnospiraceae bacterium]|nr:quinolinate synthase NadA [Lachnospiraceae bacterium]